MRLNCSAKWATKEIGVCSIFALRNFAGKACLVAGAGEVEDSLAVLYVDGDAELDGRAVVHTVGGVENAATRLL